MGATSTAEMSKTAVLSTMAYAAPAVRGAAITVVIPVHNGAAFLAETIESVLRQSRAPVEILVVNDGSTDATQAVAESFGEQVNVHRIANCGVSEARNYGIAQARTEWVALLDHDDLWEPDHLEKLAETIAQNPEADLVYGGVRRLTEISPGTFRLGDVVPTPDEKTIARLLLERCPIQTSAIVLRRSRFDQSGGFRPGLLNGQDWEMWIRLAQGGARFAASPTPTTLYRIHKLSRTHRPLRALGFYREVAEQHAAPAVPAWRRLPFRLRVVSRLEAEAAILMREMGQDGALRMMARSILRCPLGHWRRYKVLLHMLLKGYPQLSTEPKHAA